MCGEQATRDWWLTCGGSFTEANKGQAEAGNHQDGLIWVESLPDDDESLLCLITSYSTCAPRQCCVCFILCIYITAPPFSLFWSSLLDLVCSANRLNAISEVAQCLVRSYATSRKKGMMPYYHLKNFTA